MVCRHRCAETSLATPVNGQKRSCLLIDGQQCGHACIDASRSGTAGQQCCCAMLTPCSPVDGAQHEVGNNLQGFCSADSAPLRVQRQPTPLCARPSAATLRGQRGQPRRGEHPAKLQSRPTRRACDTADRELSLHCYLCPVVRYCRTLPPQSKKGDHESDGVLQAGAGCAGAAG